MNGKDKKFFVGIDIGKEENWVAFLTANSKEEIRKRLKNKNNIHGFYKLLEILEYYEKEKNINREEFILGIESTGHYWQNFYNFFSKRDYDVVMVKNRLVKLKREAKYSQKGKNDSIDSHCIGLVVKDDDYFEIKEKNKNYASLKRLTRCKEDYTKTNTQNKNRLRAWLDVNNPIYLMNFKHICCRTGLAILREFPSPRDIIDKDIEEVKEILRRDERNKRVSYRTVNEYLKLCKELYKNTIEINMGDREELKIYLMQNEILEEQLKNINKSIDKLMKETIDIYDEITEIKGLGIGDLSTLLAEIGAVENFDNARLLQSYMGLGIKSESSGKNEITKPKITKAGNKLGRKALYHIAMNLVARNEDWRKVYCYYKSYNRRNPNSNKEMLVAVACKFLRVLYGMLKTGVGYNRKELFRAFDFNKCNKEMFISEYIGEKKSWIITEEEIQELFG